MFLLQATVHSEKVSLLSLLDKGGWIMYPLYVLLLLTLYVFFERWLVMRRMERLPVSFMPMLRDHLLGNNLAAAKSLTKNTFHPIARVVDKGLQRIGKPVDFIEKSMEQVAKAELFALEKNLSLLSLVSGIAPMFGFLGTIVGMVQLFYGIAATGEYTLNTIAGGIYTKMITSATGLLIGLLAYVAHHYLSSLLDKAAFRMESAANEFLDILQEPTR